MTKKQMALEKKKSSEMSTIFWKYSWKIWKYTMER